MDDRLALFKQAHKDRQHALKQAAERAKQEQKEQAAAKKVAKKAPKPLPPVADMSGPRMLFKQAFGAEIRHRRSTLGLTLRDVAARSAIALGYLSEIERGKKEPSSEVIATLCAGMGATVPEMLIAVAFRLMDDQDVNPAERIMDDVAAIAVAHETTLTSSAS